LDKVFDGNKEEESQYYIIEYQDNPIPGGAGEYFIGKEPCFRKRREVTISTIAVRITIPARAL
jgi:hypothetical protein